MISIVEFTTIMRDVSNKPNTLRTAQATSSVKCLPSTISAIREGRTPKSDPLGVAKVAAIQAAKNTSLLIPYCHQVPLDFVGVEVELLENSVVFSTVVKAVWKTGVEMEALVAASTASLTLYDMLKPLDATMHIVETSLLTKTGGKSDALKQTASSLKGAVLVLSDLASKGEREDLSGKSIVRRLQEVGVNVGDYSILPDEVDLIEQKLRALCDQGRCDLIITTGGTGLSPRDVTPEATRRVLQKELPGVEELLRSHGQERTRYAMLGRGVAGVRGKTVIVNLPGSVGGVNDALDVLFPWLLHANEVIRGSGH